LKVLIEEVYLLNILYFEWCGIQEKKELDFFLEVLGFELRSFTLSHSTSPVFVKDFLDRVSQNYFPRLASNPDSPYLCLLSS
jgi:hypothetical protein